MLPDPLKAQCEGTIGITYQTHPNTVCDLPVGHWNAAWRSRPKVSKRIQKTCFFSLRFISEALRYQNSASNCTCAREMKLIQADAWHHRNSQVESKYLISFEEDVHTLLAKSCIWLVTRNGHDDDVHERFKWYHGVLTTLQPQSISKILSLSSKIHLSHPFSLSMSNNLGPKIHLLWIWDHHFECLQVPSQRIAATLTEGPSTATVRTPSLDAGGLSQTTEWTLRPCHFPNSTLE